MLKAVSIDTGPEGVCFPLLLSDLNKQVFFWWAGGLRVRHDHARVRKSQVLAANAKKNNRVYSESSVQSC